jgi:Cellulose biosynthesis protein BcsS
METENGFDATDSARGAYNTVVIAPFGRIDEDGFRLKLFGGYGAWSYDTKRVYCPLSHEEKKQAVGADLTAECNAIANRELSPEERDSISASIKPFGLKLEGDELFLVQTHQVARYELEALPGYQITLGAVVLKGYLGPAMEMRTVLPPDSEKVLAGSYWGAKSVIESWMRLGSASWLSADASYFTGSEAFSAAMRLGYQPLSWLTLGPEASAFGDREEDSARAGGFLRFNIGKVETTVSGGVSANYDGEMSPYGSVGMYMKF